MKTKWITTSLMAAAIVALVGCGGDGTAAGGAGGGGSCTRNYTTADLAGCYQPANSATEWYCFDGGGQWRKDLWTSVSGCYQGIESGTYEIQGCTMKSCSQKDGCGQYPVGQNQDGNLVINGIVYHESDCH